MDCAPPSYSEAIITQPAKFGVTNQLNTVPPVAVISHASATVLQPPILNELERKSVCIGDRLIFDFEKVTCYPGQSSGLHPDVKYQIPVEVNEIGVSTELWLTWMSELDDIQKLAPSICGCLCIFCFPGCFVQSVLCALCCPTSMKHIFSCLPCFYGDWYDALNKWMINVNAILNRHDMHAKLLTYKPFNNAPKSKMYGSRVAGKNKDYEMSFLAIALTRRESTVLQQESWDHGVNDSCTSGIGRCL